MQDYELNEIEEDLLELIDDLEIGMERDGADGLYMIDPVADFVNVFMHRVRRRIERERKRDSIAK